MDNIFQGLARIAGGGAELVAATGEQGLEGVMAKRLGSTYQLGKRAAVPALRGVDVSIAHARSLIAC